MKIVLIAVAIVVALYLADRLLLVFEARGWINYRRNGISRGAATYHILELSSIFNPPMESVIEAKYAQEEERDDSGDPPAAGDDEPESDGPARAAADTHGGPQARPPVRNTKRG